MKMLDQFYGTLRPEQPRAAQPWTAPAEPLSPLVSRLWALFGAARLPHFNDEEVRQLAVLLDPELQGIVNDCVALLRRRPALGAPMELGADWLEGQLRLALELDRLEPIAEELTGSAETAIAALLAELGAFSARVLLFVQATIGDDQRPEAERRRLRDQFRAVLEKDEARAELRGAHKGLGRKAEALMARAEAARGSRAVVAALRSLRGLFGQGTTDGGHK